MNTSNTRYEGTIKIDRLRLFGRHGVLPQEMIVGNEFEVNVSLTFDATLAMLSDRLDTSVNYAEVTELIKREMAQPSKLLENVVCRIYGALVWRYPQVTRGYIELRKLNPPIGAQAEASAFEFRW